MKAIEISIGIVFVYLLLSLIATIVMEIIAGSTAQRGKLLKKTIAKILGDQNLVKDFFNSSLYKQLHLAEGNTPSYISAARFGQILLESLFKGGAKVEFDALKTKIEGLPESDIKRTLLFYLNESNGKLEDFNKMLNAWYDETMEGLRGAYKRRTQRFLLVIGLCVAIIFNANSIKIYESLNEDDQKRQLIVQMAEKAVANDQFLEAAKPISHEDTLHLDSTVQAYRQQLDSIKLQYAAAANVLGLGWNCDCAGNGSWKGKSDSTFINYYALLGCPEKKDTPIELKQFFYVLFGWLITALAISLGSPFWFDLLKLLINVRNAGKSPSEKKSDTDKEGKT